MINTRAGSVVKALLEDSDTYATTLITIVLDRYGVEALDWSPQTVRMELRDDFQANVPRNNIDKIMAAATILTTDSFYKNLTKFIQLCNILSDEEFNPMVFDPADSFEMAWGITEAMLLYPPDEDEPFTDEIRYYMGYMLDEEGVIHPPDVLGIALRDQPAADPLANLSDDPTMYSAFYANQSSKSQEISDMLKEHLAELFNQLSILPLKNGNVEGLLGRMRRTSLGS